jgi:hypothetical protein
LGLIPARSREGISLISVGFWRWCISIKRIVFLDFIYHLVSQEQTKLRNWFVCHCVVVCNLYWYLAPPSFCVLWFVSSCVTN